MKVEIIENEDCVVIKIVGVMKKPDAIEFSRTIEELGKSRPKKLALDCSELAAVAFDSVPFIVSALERIRVGKKNLRAFGCNNVVERTLRGYDFERIGILETVA